MVLYCVEVRQFNRLLRSELVQALQLIF